MVEDKIKTFTGITVYSIRVRYFVVVILIRVVETYRNIRFESLYNI